MHARNPRHAQDHRLRSVAPLAALAGPLLLVLAAAVNVMLPCTGAGCVALERRSLVLLGVGAPAFPALVALPGRLPLLVSILVGAVLSVPLWGLLGRRVADHTVDGGGGWRRFWVRYAIVFAAWCAAGLVVAGLLQDALS